MPPTQCPGTHIAGRGGGATYTGPGATYTVRGGGATYTAVGGVATYVVQPAKVGALARSVSDAVVAIR
jgi:hypothetical protein